MELKGRTIEMGDQEFDHVLVRLIHFYEDNPDKARKLPPTTNFLKVLKDEMFLGGILDDAEDENYMPEKEIEEIKVDVFYNIEKHKKKEEGEE